MKFSKIAKAVAAVALIAGAIPAFAQTAPVFTIAPSAVGSASGNFQANQISGTSSELLHTTATGHYGSGWLNIGSFALNGVTVPKTGLTNDYNLYVTFDLTDTYRAGTGSGINTPDSVNDLTSLNFKFYADTNFNNTYTAANAKTSTEATVSGTGDDILLGYGSLIKGVAGFNELLGAHLNSTQTFNVTTIGSQFFAAPHPFYNIAFDEFNNTSQGASVNGNLVAINQASGSIDFNGNAVPEPESLALLGLGMLSLFATTRRRAK
jgi:hypothetical protein